jgi:hypothetical protein
MAKEVSIKLNVDAKQATNTLDELGGKFEDVYGDIQPLSGRIGELEDRLYEMALAGDKGSKEFVELSSKIADMKTVIVETDMAIDAMVGTNFGTMSSALGGVASGFQIAQGAMASFGIESEDVQEQLLKVQAAMAITDGIVGLKEASKSFKALGVAAKTALKGIKTGIAATGIGILLIAVGTIAAYWDDIKGALTGVNSEQAKLNEQAQANAEIERNKLDSLGSQDNILRSQGFTEKQILEMKIKQTDQAISAQEIAIETAETTLKSQIEAARKNKEILKGALQFISAPLDLLMKGVDNIASVFGAEWNLSDSLRDWQASFLFDPEGIEEKGMAAIEEQKKTLDKMRNEKGRER